MFCVKGWRLRRRKRIGARTECQRGKWRLAEGDAVQVSESAALIE